MAKFLIAILPLALALPAPTPTTGTGLASHPAITAAPSPEPAWTECSAHITRTKTITFVPHSGSTTFTNTFTEILPNCTWPTPTGSFMHVSETVKSESKLSVTTKTETGTWSLTHPTVSVVVPTGKPEKNESGSETVHPSVAWSASVSSWSTRTAVALGTGKPGMEGNATVGVKEGGEH